MRGVTHYPTGALAEAQLIEGYGGVYVYTAGSTFAGVTIYGRFGWLARLQKAAIPASALRKGVVSPGEGEDFTKAGPRARNLRG